MHSGPHSNSYNQYYHLLIGALGEQSLRVGVLVVVVMLFSLFYFVLNCLPKLWRSNVYTPPPNKIGLTKKNLTPIFYCRSY